MLCGGGNCKIVKRHFPAIWIAVQLGTGPVIFSQSVRPVVQLLFMCCEFELCMYMCVRVRVCVDMLVYLLSMSWPGVNWIMFDAQALLKKKKQMKWNTEIDSGISQRIQTENHEILHINKPQDIRNENHPINSI